jgi:cbb3-type cytochrome oxidase subunit 3
MSSQTLLLIAVSIAIASVVIFVIRRNNKDEKDYEKEMDEEDKIPYEHPHNEDDKP